MERIILAVVLLASIIAVRTSEHPAASCPPGTSASEMPMEAAAHPVVVHVPPIPPIPPVPPVPPVPAFDFDFDFDFDPSTVISRTLRRGEHATCPAGTVCDYRCDDGGCAVACDAGSVCATACDGGYCKLACATGAVCSLECDGDVCKSDCARGSVCAID